MSNLWLVLALTVCAVQAQADPQITGCTEGSKYIISLNETLTPPSDVSSSAIIGSPFFAPARNALHFGHDEGGTLITWCTISTDQNPSVTINFSEPVVITDFISSGTTFQPTSLTAYITNFTIEYTQRNENGDVSTVYYRTQNDNSIKYFTQNKLVKLFNLERPIATETSIRIRPIKWVDSTATPEREGDAVCIGVGLIGCRTSDASFEQVPATTEEMTTATMESTTESAVTMESTVSDGPVTEGTTDVGGVATGQQIIVKDYQVLEIALPIALLTILVVLVAVVLGVLLCVSRGRKDNKYDISQATPTNTVTTPTNPSARILDNSELYYSPTETRRDTIREVTNDLYGEDSGTNTHTVAHDNLEVIYSDTQYTEVPMGELSRRDRRDSMEDNSAYAMVSSPEVESDNNYSFSLENNTSYSTLLAEGGGNVRENIYADNVC